MKKALGMLLTLALLACALSGCAKKAPGVFTADNEIYTYDKIDESKTQLTVSMIGNNANVQRLSKAFEEANPDIQVINVDITGGDASYRPVIDWVTHGVAPDIMLVNSDSFIDDDTIKSHLTDLSANPAVSNFEADALNRLEIDGHLYFLPAPSEVNCMIYNKTLFEQYGWQVPATFDEFISLCQQIREDTGGEVQPWNPNAKYDSILTIATEAFVYEELFGGAKNREWYNAYCDGSATFAGHMEPYYQMLQTLIDNGLIAQEHFTYSATTRGKEFKAGKIAMINSALSVYKSDEYEFDLMPYPTTSGNLGYVNDYFSALFCVPKKAHTEKETDAVNRYIAFFGSTEGQLALIGDGLMVSNVKNVPLTQSETLAGIEEVIRQGHKFTRLDFSRNGAHSWTFQENAMQMVAGEKTGAQCIEEIDQLPHDAAAAKTDEPREVLAEVTEDFTIFEFSCYLTDMYREKAGAEIGLINHGIAYRGNLIRLFKGFLYEGYDTVLKPRSFANQSTLVKVSMTGSQLLHALNHPVDNDSTSDSVYAFSGLKCEIAPWNELGKKYLSVKLTNGSEIEPDRLYTVAVWDGTVPAEDITEVLEAYEGTFEALLSAKLKADGKIAPAKDGRAKFTWK